MGLCECLFQGKLRIISSIILILGVFLLIVLSISVVAPNFHGLKFEEGLCHIKYVETVGNRRCDCSSSSNNNDDDDHCTSYYPCISVHGYFKFIGNETWLYAGSFHSNYFSLQQECLYIPSCSRSYITNRYSVQNYYDMTIPQRLDTIFPCYGNGKDMYFFNNYSLAKGLTGLIIPLVMIGFSLMMKLFIHCSFPDVSFSRRNRSDPQLGPYNSSPEPIHRNNYEEQPTRLPGIPPPAEYVGPNPPPPSYDAIMSNSHPVGYQTAPGFQAAPPYLPPQYDKYSAPPPS